MRQLKCPPARSLRDFAETPRKMQTQCDGHCSSALSCIRTSKAAVLCDSGKVLRMWKAQERFRGCRGGKALKSWSKKVWRRLKILYSWLGTGLL